MALRIAVFGQADFGKTCVDRFLENGHEVVAVFAPPEGGRPDALAERATQLGLPLIRRRHFQKKGGEPIAAALEAHRALDADLNVMASFTSFLPRAITNAPRYKSLCFHPSLLPRYRGGEAMQWQIILGEPETGVSIFIPDEGVDTGPVVLQKSGVKIGPLDTTGTLFFKKLLPLGIDAMVEAVELIDQGTARPAVQDESRASHQGLVTQEDAAIDLSRKALQIDQLVRGCDPQPGAYVRFAGEPLRLYNVSLEIESAGAPGSVSAIDENGILIALDGGSLRVGRVRADAGKEAAVDFAARRGLSVGDRVANG